MTAPIALRSDFDGLGLRRLARATKDAAQARRLLALAAIYEGGSRTEAARIGSVTLQIIRDWVMRFVDNSLQHAVKMQARETYRMLGGTDAEWIGGSIPLAPNETPTEMHRTAPGVAEAVARREEKPNERLNSFLDQAV